jgi:xanthine dehydrogenase accessory factor
MALMEALESDAFYVGSLGSARTNQARLTRLAALDVPPEAIARLRGPIGLPIGSHTPMEIAISIAAELIAVRNNAAVASRNTTPEPATSNQAAVG